MLTTYEKAQRLIKAATGEEYGDGYIVTDICVGYAEPGYGNEDDVIVFGNWNNTYPQWGWFVKTLSGDRFPSTPNTTKKDTIPSRLVNALERIGVKCEWLDEWSQCGNCYRAMRTTADSYSWTLYGEFSEGLGEYTCANCMQEDANLYLDDYINNPQRAITWCNPSTIESLGFVRWEPGNPQTYESGWHTGQDDSPDTILDSIHEIHPNAEVVFFINSVGQFDVRFSAYIRLPEDSE